MMGVKLIKQRLMNMKKDTSSEGSEKAFERRIRSHIIGPPHRFAVIVPRELAPVCLREVEALGIEGAEQSDAGVEFVGKMSSACLCHLWLRTASRIYCRLPEFRAGVAEELFYKVSEMGWDLWIDPQFPVEVEAHVECSRISHEGKAADAVFEGIERSIRENIPAAARLKRTGTVPGEAEAAPAGVSEPKQKILVHLVKNHCRISLDMSGRHLHERGYRLEHSGAPLRETIAAAILLKSEWSGETPLVDGMCGSGTFPVEAAMIARRLPPGLKREFLFQKWPSFQKKTWQFLCRSAREEAAAEAGRPIVGIDVDPASMDVSRANAERAGVAGDIRWKEMDFFQFDPLREKLKKGLVVLNPPYGRRLEGGGRPFYEKLGVQLRKSYRGWKYGVLCPTRSEAAAMKMPSMRLWGVRHGGIPIYVALGTVS